MKLTQKAFSYVWGIVALAIAIIAFVIPFIFIFFTASKSASEAQELQFSLPSEWKLLENLGKVFESYYYPVQSYDF